MSRLRHVTALLSGRTLREVDARLRRVEATLADVAGTVGRQAPVVRRIDDRTRVLIAEGAAEAVAARDAADRRVGVVRDLSSGQAFCAELGVGERALLVVPRDVDPALATRLVTALSDAAVEVIPEAVLMDGLGTGQAGL